MSTADQLADCPALMELAAYVDGRMSGPALDTIEAHLADCAACRESVGAVRSLQATLAGTLTPAPPAVIGAAKALVRGAAPPSRWRLADWFAASRWPVAAAASIAIGVAGFRLGAASTTGGIAEPHLVAEISFGLLEPFGPGQPGWDILLTVVEEGSR